MDGLDEHHGIIIITIKVNSLWRKTYLEELA